MTPVLPPPHFRSSLSPLFLLPSKNIELTEGHPPLCCDHMLLKCLFATSLLLPVRAAGPWWEEKLNQCGEVAAVLLRLQTRGNERDEKKRSDKMFLVRRSRVLRLCFHLPLRLVVWRPTMGGNSEGEASWRCVTRKGNKRWGSTDTKQNHRCTSGLLIKIQLTACWFFFLHAGREEARIRSFFKYIPERNVYLCTVSGRLGV